jgi:NitT/TauT family transport system ATP-binding protein
VDRLPKANLLPWRTVAGNLRLGVELQGKPPTDLDARIIAMLRLLGLQDFAERYPHELSGGMQQRVAIGQALMANPRILLMDEPFGALDALTRDRLNVELLRMWQADRKTVILVTHSIAEAIFLADRVLVMSARPGRVIEDLKIALPRPRDPRSTREMPDFGKYVVHLSELMGVS